MRRRHGLWLWIALLALLFTACATTTATPGGPSSPTASATGEKTSLSCTIALSAVGVDVIKQVLTCKVTGAPAGDTGMTLSYYAEGAAGQKRLMQPPCTGTLSHGSGSCTQTYDSPAPMGTGPGSVQGQTEPSHRALGPVVPTPVPGTPGPGSLTPVATLAQ